MNDFDDILAQSYAPQKSTLTEEPTKEKPQKEWWQIREEKERAEAYGMLDSIFKAFSAGDGNIQSYLDTHSRFDRYSARNALLIAAKAPNATQIGDFKYWKSKGVEILKTEKRNPIIILEPGKPYRKEDGSMGQNFYAKEVFDVSQTTGRGQAEPQVAYDERLLLKALINNPPVSIQPVEQLPDEGRGAMFSAEQNAILVKKGMDAPDIFRCVSLELANVQLAKADAEYSRETEGYKAYCVSYMLCKKYGIETQGYDVSRLKGVFQGQDPKTEIPRALSDMENAMGSINSRMAKVLGMSRADRQKEQQR